MSKDYPLRRSRGLSRPLRQKSTGKLSALRGLSVENRGRPDLTSLFAACSMTRGPHPPSLLTFFLGALAFISRGLLGEGVKHEEEEA
jgi:hypothetical protein